VLHDKYKGPLSPEFVDDFEHYADALFSSFPRIKNWMVRGGGRHVLLCVVVCCGLL
jgi:beta-glucosidase/6-phospho-beta-glucosidase/beta-galactosidase